MIRADDWEDELDCNIPGHRLSPGHGEVLIQVNLFPGTKMRLFSSNRVIQFFRLVVRFTYNTLYGADSRHFVSPVKYCSFKKKKAMPKTSGMYQDVYIRREGAFVSLKDDVTDFCEKYIKPVHPRNWDWSKRDFENPKNDPTIEEARAIRNVIYKDMNARKRADVDLSTMENIDAIKAYLNPKSKHEAFNMEEFAYAIKVELEHGKMKDVNVTCNHPFLTAMIALAHMVETLTYYKRLQVMEAEGEIFELLRKLKKARKGKEELHSKLIKTEEELIRHRKELSERLEKMDDIPVMKSIGE